MKNTLFFSGLFLMFTLVGCGSKVTKKAMKRGEALKSSLYSFETNRQKLSVDVVQSLEEVEQELTGEDPDMPKIAKNWEKEWKDVQGRYDKMRRDFDKVGKNSDSYFEQLNKLSASINNEELKASELAKNDELKTRWMTSYQEAAVSIEKITEVLNSGNDFHMVLVASSIRQKLEQNVEELKIIAAQAKTLLSDLEAFTIAGKELVDG